MKRDYKILEEILFYMETIGFEPNPDEYMQILAKFSLYYANVTHNIVGYSVFTQDNWNEIKIIPKDNGGELSINIEFEIEHFVIDLPALSDITDLTKPLDYEDHLKNVCNMDVDAVDGIISDAKSHQYITNLFDSL